MQYRQPPALRAGGGGDCFWVTHQGTPCAVVKGAREVVAPRYAGFRLVPHIREAVTQLRQRGVRERGTICSASGSSSQMISMARIFGAPETLKIDFLGPFQKF